jgi:hypothetical protein
MPNRVGFLEELPGHFSMTRLLALMAGIGGFLVLLTCCVVALKGGSEAAGIIAALAALYAGAMAGVWSAIKERTKTDDPTPGVEGS